MAQFVKVSMDNGKAEYVNLDLVRTVEDNPTEGSVRVDFDQDHRVYLDRERAKTFLDVLQQAPS